MILQKHICMFCSFFIAQCLTAQYVNGYEIKGYKIDASQRATMVLNFNSAVTGFYISEKKSPYTVSALDRKALKIETSGEASKPYDLFVTEGGRKHNFVIIYKDSIDFSKQIQDFSDLNKLKLITDSLQYQGEKEKQVLQQQRNLFDSLSNAGDLALTDSDYNNALINYEKALTIPMPADTSYYYIRQQINYLKKEIPARDARNKQKREEEEHARQVAYAIDLYNRAQDSVKFGNFNEALKSFKQFISYVDSTRLTSNEYDFEKLLNYSKIKASTIKSYIDTIEAKNRRGDTLAHKSPVIKSLPSVSVIYYPNPKDPKLDTMYRKYPGIDFNTAPDNQLFDSIDLSQETKLKSKNIMSANPIAISEATNNGLRLSCDNLIFKDDKVYIKLMLSNFTSSEFLTGNMLLIKKEYGNSIAILPIYVSGYPIILPNEQKVIVYVCNYKPMTQGQNLEFEVNDRLNKAKIKIIISGEIYNREQKKFSQRN